MKRFLMQNYKLADVNSVTTSGASSTSVGTYVDAEGFDIVNVLSRVKSTTASVDKANLQLMAASATGGTGATAVATCSAKVTTTNQIMGLQSAANIAGADKHYFAIKATCPAGGDKIAVQNLFFLGGPRRAPIGTTTTATEDAEHHINTVISTTVAT